MGHTPVSKLTTLRNLLSFAAQNKWKFDHLDVVTVLLNPEINAAVHMELPEGIEWLSAQTAHYAKNRRPASK